MCLEVVKNIKNVVENNSLRSPIIGEMFFYSTIYHYCFVFKIIL